MDSIRVRGEMAGDGWPRTICSLTNVISTMQQFSHPKEFIHSYSFIAFKIQKEALASMRVAEKEKIEWNDEKI